MVKFFLIISLLGSGNLFAEQQLCNYSIFTLPTENIQIRDSVDLLWKKYLQAKSFALSIHKDQLYGDQAFSDHLKSVEKVLFYFGFNLNENKTKLNILLAIGAWLHDTIEDTDVTYLDLERKFGPNIAALIMTLTNEIPMAGESQISAKRRTFRKISNHPYARLIKLADRISNMENSIKTAKTGDSSYLIHYKNEWIEFQKLLKPAKDYIFFNNEKKMWRYLDYLMMTSI